MHRTIKRGVSGLPGLLLQLWTPGADLPQRLMLGLGESAPHCALSASANRHVGGVRGPDPALPPLLSLCRNTLVPAPSLVCLCRGSDTLLLLPPSRVLLSPSAPWKPHTLWQRPIVPVPGLAPVPGSRHAPLALPVWLRVTCGLSFHPLSKLLSQHLGKGPRTWCGQMEAGSIL